MKLHAINPSVLFTTLVFGLASLACSHSNQKLPAPTKAASAATSETGNEKTFEMTFNKRERSVSQHVDCDDGAEPTLEILGKTAVLNCSDGPRMKAVCPIAPVVTKIDGHFHIKCT